MSRPRRAVMSPRAILLTAVVVLAGSGLALASPQSTNVHLGKIAFGPYMAHRLEDAHHYALYISTHDQRNRSRCLRQCLTAFTPLIARGHLRAWNGVKQKLLGSISRGHGVRQVTYNHHALYTATADVPGTAYADGCTGFGGTWYVIGKNGNPDKRFNWGGGNCGGGY